jgi:hypothetical protein
LTGIARPVLGDESGAQSMPHLHGNVTNACITAGRTTKDLRS